MTWLGGHGAGVAGELLEVADDLRRLADAVEHEVAPSWCGPARALHDLRIGAAVASLRTAAAELRWTASRTLEAATSWTDVAP